MTQCTPTSTLLERIGDETSRRAARLHDELGLPREAAARWAHDQRTDERRERAHDQRADERRKRLEINAKVALELRRLGYSERYLQKWGYA